MKIFFYKIILVIFFYSIFGCNMKNEVFDLILKFLIFNRFFLLVN